MDTKPSFERPDFDKAVAAWKEVLGGKGYPVECTWVFDENLCFEADPARPGGYRLGFQVSITPPPQEAERVGYDYFSDFELPIVFYRLGNCHGKSVCVMMCDSWFNPKGEPEGYISKPEWRLLFHPGGPGEVEEINDPERWRKRVVKNRPLHELDFAMNLRAVHEILAHGRALTSYEHYALRFLHAWSRFLGQPK